MPDKNFESFDLWSEAQFAMWSNIRYDFELIAECVRHFNGSSKRTLELLHTVNKYVDLSDKDALFDGTINCLKYLVKNELLKIDTLPLLTSDEKFLVELLKKYAHRLQITDVYADIEDKTIKAIVFEYPNLFDELIQDNPYVGSLIGRALQKNGVNSYEEFVEKIDDGVDSIEVDTDKNSSEAMKCKLVFIGLYLYCGKVMLPKGNSHLVEQITSLTDSSIESGSYSKTTFNAVYSGIYGSRKWNEERKMHLSGCETLWVNFQLLSMSDNHMTVIYDIFLKEIVQQVGEKYFGKEFKYEGFIASLAIKMVIVIILFRAENYIPKGENADVHLFTAGALLGGLNYAVEETDKKERPLQLKKWFEEYFRDELDKRMAFIKLQIENDVAVVEWGKRRVIYLPVFESFKFFCNRQGMLVEIIKLFKNKSVSNDVKDEIFINFALNTQKIVGSTHEVSKEEHEIKDAFLLLISEAFKGLQVNAAKQVSQSVKKYYEKSDVSSEAELAVIELVNAFDLEKSDSFIAYLKFNLPLKLKTNVRGKKIDYSTDTAASLPDDFFDVLPDADDFEQSLNDKHNIEKIRSCLENLPPKEKEAVGKLFEQNDASFSDTERKAKNRGLNKIRKMVSDL